MAALALEQQVVLVIHFAYAEEVDYVGVSHTQSILGGVHWELGLMQDALMGRSCKTGVAKASKHQLCIHHTVLDTLVPEAWARASAQLCR